MFMSAQDPHTHTLQVTDTNTTLYYLFYVHTFVNVSPRLWKQMKKNVAKQTTDGKTQQQLQLLICRSCASKQRDSIVLRSNELPFILDYASQITQLHVTELQTTVKHAIIQVLIHQHQKSLCFLLSVFNSMTTKIYPVL